MSFNISAGNPRAHRIRVYYEDSSTIYEGMPVCYNYDTTDNWFGGTLTAGVVSGTGTTAEGSQNEGKYIRVEDPSTTNLQWFAGVVAKGAWLTLDGPRIIEIYAPNGAIVPCRVDIDTTEAGRTIVAIEDDSQALTALGTSSNYTTRPVGVAAEDISTTGLCLVELDPNMFICQDLATSSNSLIVSTTGTGYSALNRINVTDAFSAGSFCAFEIKSTHTGGVEAGMGLGFMVKTVINTTGPTARSCAAGIQLRIDSGTISTEVAALRLYLRETAATWSVAGSYGASVLSLTCQVTTDVTANKLSWILIENDGAQIPDQFIYVPVIGDIGDVACAIGGTVTFNTQDRMIPVRIAAHTYYIPLLETNS